MPFIFKCTMFFNGPKHGWSETHWYSSPNSAYPPVMLTLETLATRRAPLMGKECSIIGLRVSIENPIRNDAMSRDLEGFVGYSGYTADEPDAALLLRASDPSFAKHKQIYLRGIPDAIDVNFGTYDPSLAGWDVRLQAYEDYLVNQLFGWLGVIGSGPVKANLTGYTQGVTGQVTVNVATDLFPLGLIGTNVIARGAKINTPQKSVLNNQQVYTVLSARSAITTQPIGVLPYTHGGYLSYTPLEFWKYADVRARRIVSRRVGSPLLSSRGRSKVRSKG